MKYFKSFLICFTTLLLITTLLLLANCKQKETAVQKATKEKMLLIAIGSDPMHLDPAFGSTSEDNAIMRALFETLVILDPETLTPRPGVATHWEISKDGLTYTFYLRKNARFSNGDPVTAHDFVFSIQRILSPQLGSPEAKYFDQLRNSKEYNEGTITDFNKVGVKALNDYTIQLNLSHPNPFFLHIVSDEFLSPLHRKTLEKFNAIETKNSEWIRPENLVGNGPFIIKEWRINDYIEVERNPHYWDANNVKLNKIRFFIMSDRMTQEHAFRAGQLHITYSLPGRIAAFYRKTQYPYLRTSYLNGIYAYIFNTRIYPLNDIRIRKALSLAINRSQIAEEVFVDGRAPAYNLISTINYEYDPISFIQEDVKKAQEFLVQAGFPNGKGFPKLEIVFNTDETHLNVAQAIQAMWKKNLNINVDLINVEWKALIEKLHRGDFQIMRMAWLSPIQDPLFFMRSFVKSSPDIPTGWFNPQYDFLIEKALLASDLETRLKYIEEAEAILIDELPIMPISFPAVNFLLSSDVKGWHNNFSNINYFQFIDLVPAQ